MVTGVQTCALPIWLLTSILVPRLRIIRDIHFLQLHVIMVWAGKTTTSSMSTSGISSVPLAMWVSYPISYHLFLSVDPYRITKSIWIWKWSHSYKSCCTIIKVYNSYMVHNIWLSHIIVYLAWYNVKLWHAQNSR
jgi:hypothetical protein